MLRNAVPLLRQVLESRLESVSDVLPSRYMEVLLSDSIQVIMPVGHVERTGSYEYPQHDDACNLAHGTGRV